MSARCVPSAVMLTIAPLFALFLCPEEGRPAGQDGRRSDTLSPRSTAVRILLCVSVAITSTLPLLRPCVHRLRVTELPSLVGHEGSNFREQRYRIRRQRFPDLREIQDTVEPEFSVSTGLNRLAGH